MYSEEYFAEMLLRLRAVNLRTYPPYVWASGILSPIYTDNRILISFPEERKQIITALASIIQKNISGVFGFAGTATAGIPWAAWLAQEFDVPMIFVRSSAKIHCKENLIEGKITTGMEYVVVEDVISTGKSAIHSVNAVRDAGGKAQHCISIFSYEFSDAQKKFQEQNCRLHSLLNFSTLVRKAIEMNYLSESEKESIFLWKENPTQWK